MEVTGQYPAHLSAASGYDDSHDALKDLNMFNSILLHRSGCHQAKAEHVQISTEVNGSW
jgi:hypothetical protein